MTRTSLILALALALPATTALAQGGATGISWSYFDLGLQHTMPDDDRLDDSTGGGIRGAGAINDNWHVFLGWNRSAVEGRQDFSATGGVPGTVSIDDDVDRYGIGLGYNLPVGATADLFARVGYERVGAADFDVVVADQVSRAKLDSTDGFSVEVGVRAAFAPRFEAGASVRHVSLDDPEVRIGDQPVDTQDLLDGDSRTSLLLYGQFKFGNGWGLIAEGDLNSDYNALFVGARLSY